MQADFSAVVLRHDNYIGSFAAAVVNSYLRNKLRSPTNIVLQIRFTTLSIRIEIKRILFVSCDS